MPNELEQRLRSVLPRTPQPDHGLEEATRQRVRRALPAPPSRSRRFVRVAMPALGLAGIGAVLFAALPRGTDTPARPVAREPELRLAAADPATGLFDPVTSISALRGRVVVLGFVSRTCADCTEVFGPALTQWASKVSFVQVFPDLTLAQGRKIGEGRLPGADFQRSPVAIDPRGELAEHFEVSSEPTVVVLDKFGRQTARFTEQPGATLTRLIARLEKQKGPAGYPKPRPSLPLFPVLQGPANLTEPLPENVRGILEENCQLIPGSVRLAASGPNGMRVWLARSADGGIPIASTYGPAAFGGGGVGCGISRYAADREKMLRRAQGSGVYNLEYGSGRGRWGLSLVVLDGWTELRVAGQRIPITNNAVITAGTGTPPQTATLTGPRGARIVRMRW